MQRMEFDEGEVIFNQGDRSSACYQVVSGAVEIRLSGHGTPGGGPDRVIERLDYGDVFGEMGLIDEAPRSATAVALGPTVCVVYSREEILGLLENSPEEALDYIRKLIRRLRDSNERTAREARPAEASHGMPLPPAPAGSGRAPER